MFRPPSFLQHTVDQMLLHSSWVVNFISLCDEKDFAVNDPFMAHLASITATAFVFLFNAKDLDLAEKARQSFDRCYSFVKNSSSTWNHLTNTASLHPQASARAANVRPPTNLRSIASYRFISLTS